jgi:uncharacterized membrane protein YwzB
MFVNVILIATVCINWEEFIVDRRLKQQDVISVILFNIVLEYVITRFTITVKIPF